MCAHDLYVEFTDNTPWNRTLNVNIAPGDWPSETTNSKDGAGMQIELGIHCIQFPNCFLISTYKTC